MTYRSSKEEKLWERFRKNLNLTGSGLEVDVRIAKTKCELEQAYQLVHNAYLEAGFTKGDGTGIRFNAYHALPGTTVLIVTVRNQVVGTISLIQDSFLGLPSEKAFNLQKFRARGHIGEVSALAVAPEYRAKRAEVLYGLIRLMARYTLERTGVKYWVISVNPKHRTFYQWLLGFKEFGEAKTYDFANGAPAIGLYCDLRNLKSDLLKCYESHPTQSNFYRYCFEEAEALFGLPDRPYFSQSDPVMSPSILRYFTQEKTALWNHLPAREIEYLRRIYCHPTYRSLLQTPTHIQGRDLRFSVAYRAKVVLTERCLEVTDISLRGIKLKASENYGLGEKLKLHLQMGPHRKTLIEAHVRWRRKDVVGCVIKNHTLEWIRMAEHHLAELLSVEEAA